MNQDQNQKTPREASGTDAAEKKRMQTRWWLIRLGMVAVDIITVNLAYLIALFLRFYVGSEFNEYALWCIPAFVKFAPYYTVCCVIVFASLKLYSGMWKYAGIHDMNRIILASLITAAVQILGTLLFIGRMPVTYYVLGALIQFLMLTASRFSYRLISAERTVALKSQNETELNVMIVGVGETGQLVRRKLNDDHNSAAKIVCMFNYDGREAGSLLDGIPLVSGIAKLTDSIEKYHVDTIILADSSIPENVQERIRSISEEKKLTIQDFSVYFQIDGTGLSLKKLVRFVSGPIDIVVDGKTIRFPNGEQVLHTLHGQYEVKSIAASGDRLLVVLFEHQIVRNSTDESWIQEFEQETGESVSFF